MGHPEGAVYDPAAEAEDKHITFTEGYLGRPPQTDIYQVDYFLGSKGLIPPDGSFLNPESDYRFKAQDILQWMSQYVPEGTILDVGAGPGHMAYWATKQGKPLSIVSCDISTSLLASEYNQNPQASVVSNVHELPFRGDALEGILFSDVLEHIWPYQAVKAVEEAHRILKDDGYIFINIPNRDAWTDAAAHHEGHVWLPSIDEVKTLLDLGGFTGHPIHVLTRGFEDSKAFREAHGYDPRRPVGGTSIFACVQK